VFCTRCGRENAADSHFCANCGAALHGDRPSEQTSTLALGAVEDHHDEESASEDAAVDALPHGSALLVVKRGPNAGSRFLLDRERTTVGRHPDSDIFLDDVTVSRRHAEFRRQEGGGFAVRDVGSLNGTYLNRERIETSELVGGDEVQIGKFRLVFFVGPRREGSA
jgi:pSer/pThr/pTyr-binding forkhead associated (FHA) protein